MFFFAQNYILYRTLPSLCLGVSSFGVRQFLSQDLVGFEEDLFSVFYHEITILLHFIFFLFQSKTVLFSSDFFADLTKLQYTYLQPLSNVCRFSNNSL